MTKRRQRHDDLRDNDLCSRVRQALAADPGFSGYGIEVDVRGGDVHLTGVVDVLSEKERAGRVAAAAAGEARIENGLTISTDGAIDDEDVEFEIAEEFAHDPRLDPKQVGATVSGGVAHLVGRADTLEEAAVAASVAAKARGVREVVSELSLTGYAVVDDATLANRVQDALLADTEVRAANIRALSCDGVVRLTGSVPDSSDLEAAVAAAKGVGGAQRVVDELEVEEIIPTRGPTSF